MGNIKYYRGSFTKASGDLRTMFFVRAEDMPSSFITENTAGTGKTRNLKEGLETVWDLQATGWRTFNWKTADTDEVTTFEGKEDILNNFKSSDV
jgi:hypothetical protein|tara:strand:- start:511 stop:792 length:282 start_codon:yes stop_codon:yes gene_type:complete